ncbi:MAG: DUF354 domain-containing protein [Methanocorpusculum sp.]|nr:DUF354 domain-containing protein [Methanocorpusculum sp.]
MKIVVDINHPAHVHYFKNFIWEMEKKGHEILITVSDKDIARQLLDLYGFKYVLLGSYGKGIVKKAINVPILDFRMWKAVHKFNPDLFVGFSTIRGSHISFLMRKKTIALDDTEPATLQRMLYHPFANAILTPACFQKDLGSKQVRYDGYADLFYLHPNRFIPNPDILKEVGISEKDTFFIVRFVSFDANHDIGQSGIHDKVKLVKLLSEYGRVLITSEASLPNELEKYRYRAPVNKMHDLMYYATLVIGESPTMASEAACMGVHAVLITTFKVGYNKDEEDKYNLVTNFSNPNTDDEEIIDKIISLIVDPATKGDSRKMRLKLLSDSCDPTTVLIDLAEKLTDEKRSN